MVKSQKINESVLKKLGARIVNLRKKKGMSQNKLALDIDWERNNLSKIENGQNNVTIDTLIKISKALDVTLSELLKGID
jgi:transcriptional regulator with XRE-family HTH domain